MIRIGCGFDMHPLSPARPLMLGGVEIPGAPGLLGHSDADALSHALCDALLGAAAMGDIGQMFPNSQPEFRGARSLELLARVRAEVAARHNARVVNADATVALQSPRLAPHIPAMRANLARLPEFEIAGEKTVRTLADDMSIGFRRIAYLGYADREGTIRH